MRQRHHLCLIYVRISSIMEENKEEKKGKKALKITGNIIFYTFFTLIFGLACLSITSRITNGRVGDSQYLVVISSSMDGDKKNEYEIQSIPVKSLIKVDLVKSGKEDEFYSSLKKGDVLTFNYIPLDNNTITHRIISDPTKLDDGTYVFKLKGDAVDGENEIQTLYSDGRNGEILGKVTFVSLPLGQIYFFMSSKVGTLVLVILPSSAICIFEIAKIIYLVSENNRKKKELAYSEEKATKAKEIENKDKEIEELKRQLEEAKKKEGGKEE